MELIRTLQREWDTDVNTKRVQELKVWSVDLLEKDPTEGYPPMEHTIPFYTSREWEVNKKTGEKLLIWTASPNENLHDLIFNHFGSRFLGDAPELHKDWTFTEPTDD